MDSDDSDIMQLDGGLRGKFLFNIKNVIGSGKFGTVLKGK